MMILNTRECRFCAWTTCGASVQLLMLAYLSAPTGGKCLAMLTNEGSEMAYELRDPSSRHKKEAGAYFLQSF